MSPFTEVPVSASVKTLMEVYTRKESPSVYSPVAGELPEGSVVRIQATVVGDAVQGNPHWYRIDEETFIWAGACTPITPCPAFPPVTRVNWTAVVFEVR
ncbi:SH3 domain-containing protein [Leclercia adecarboxylata]|uniref:SH3 domain-containing protein n=1 Tax=Leclercia adecarboxylata TaxID=83655 RepID=UPI002DB75551|nr:SH3 domain-containing protein [Leclercia adecarboxylata]MEB6379717.1 SH3 domain-containing protein [Leclercia adecarboxylata]